MSSDTTAAQPLQGDVTNHQGQPWQSGHPTEPGTAVQPYRGHPVQLRPDRTPTPRPQGIIDRWGYEAGLTKWRNRGGGPATSDAPPAATGGGGGAAGGPPARRRDGRVLHWRTPQAQRRPWRRPGGGQAPPPGQGAEAAVRLVQGAYRDRRVDPAAVKELGWHLGRREAAAVGRALTGEAKGAKKAKRRGWARFWHWWFAKPHEAPEVIPGGLGEWILAIRDGRAPSHAAEATMRSTIGRRAAGRFREILAAR